MRSQAFQRRATGCVFVLAAIVASFLIVQDGEERDTIVVVVRHAEKGPRAEDDLKTPLSAEGRKRAEALAHALGVLGVEVVYTSDALRTKQTVGPLAAARNIEPLEHTNVDELLLEIRSKQRGKVILVAGHSNTVPEIVAKLGGGDIGQIDDKKYDELFLVVLRPTGEARLLKLKYGVATPG